jgi:hypothetical protein
MIGNLDVMMHKALGDDDQAGVENFIIDDLGLDLDKTFLITVDDDPAGRTIEVGVFRVNDEGHKFVVGDEIAWAIEMFERFPDGQYAHTGTEEMN